MHSLLTVFGEVFEDAATYGARRPDDAHLQRLLASDSFIGIVALRHERIVGGLTAYELQRFEQARSEVYLYDLAVALPYRRQGIATALLKELKHISAARGAYVILVQADHGDDQVIALYSKFGTQEDVLHFDIPTDDGDLS